MATIDPDLPCPHENMAANVEVNRLSQEEGGPISNFATDITVWCADCDEKFRWIGVEAGLMPDRPMCSVDETELRRTDPTGVVGPGLRHGPPRLRRVDEDTG